MCTVQCPVQNIAFTLRNHQYCSALMTYMNGVILVKLHLLWHQPKDRLIWSLCMTTEGCVGPVLNILKSPVYIVNHNVKLLSVWKSILRHLLYFHCFNFCHGVYMLIVNHYIMVIENLSQTYIWIFYQISLKV